MRKLFFGLLPVAAVMFAAPASAQLIYTGPGGAPVPVWGDYLHYYDYSWPAAYRQSPPSPAYAAADCRVIRERIATPGGRVIIKTRRAC